MVKESIICGVIVISIIFGNYKTQGYTKESVAEISNDLEALRQEISKGEEEIDEDKTKEKILGIYEEWNKRHDKLAYFIEHDELEKVETNLTSTKSFIETKEYSDSIEEIDRGIFVLKHIEEKYAFNLQNIF